MSKPSEETNIKASILPLSAGDVCHCWHPHISPGIFYVSKIINRKVYPQQSSIHFIGSSPETFDFARIF
jgi:hypothetical protein